VVIAGEGGDELFAGYPWHRLFNYVGNLYDRGVSNASWHAPELPGHLLPKGASLLFPGRPFAQRYLEFIAIFSSREVRKLLGVGKRGSALHIFSGFLESHEGTTLSRMLVCDAMTRLSESYLMK